jgi:hypothetical protein
MPACAGHDKTGRFGVLFVFLPLFFYRCFGVAFVDVFIDVCTVVFAAAAVRPLT